MCIRDRIAGKASDAIRLPLEQKVRKWLTRVNGLRVEAELVNTAVFCEFDGEWWLGHVASYEDYEYTIRFMGDGSEERYAHDELGQEARPAEYVSVPPGGETVENIAYKYRVFDRNLREVNPQMREMVPNQRLESGMQVMLPYRPKHGFASGEDLFYTHLSTAEVIEAQQKLDETRQRKNPTAHSQKASYMSKCAAPKPRGSNKAAQLPGKWVQYGRKMNLHTNSIKVYYKCIHPNCTATVSYTHLRAHETVLDLVCRLLLEKKKTRPYY
eukprot:TRINITY_DN39768_c0_g1_i1.p1 TRINITY_DN39768_c0_g1~~TRINITY_DN39768_c0_g1_i1.p1  ORF type:complete len:270 (+),score=53.08 TRINITY_DN39768_c0_g1_i1:100-909(+)